MLKWQSIVFVAGASWTCLESYDSIHDRLRDGEFKQTADEDGLRWMAPLELTFKAEVGGSVKVVRALVAPHAISLVLDIPATEREPVEDV
jgi:hypothetical protein